jgi:phosphoribosylformimino-5-aminoimidazole carboxamide ribonucleotide (ProFAR) isomerase
MYSKGVSWIDDCRIPHSEEIMVAIDYKETKQSENGWNTKNRILEPSNRGRFPANILVSDDMLNDGNKGGSAYCPPTKYEYEMSVDKFNSGGKRTKTGFGDKGSNSRYYDIDKWFENLIK